MNSSSERQSLADKASALRWAAAVLSATNGSTSLWAFTCSRVSAPLRPDWFETRVGFGGARFGTRRSEAQDGRAAADGDCDRDATDERGTQAPAPVSKDRALPNGAGPNI